jgi:hypothetical protein
MSDAEASCKQVNEWLEALPKFKNPSQVPFTNGLYFFYEDGEASSHSPDGRIVRIGNHPRKQDGLKKRLNMHYRGSKNSSVFRKFLGGAIMRQENPNNPCLLPGPGQGHWEKQDIHACEKCKPTETKVTDLLERTFRFRCLKIDDLALRNIMEEKLVATASICRVCKPSKDWLGKYAYAEKVRSSGLWNSNYVFEVEKRLNPYDLKKLQELIGQTLHL